jgi:uridine phosphorylase
MPFMTTGAVDKASVGLTGKQYHVGVELGEISDIVLMPGDPFRVQLIADQLDNPVEVAHRREYRTVNGHYKERLITGCSSGMGCPSTAIGVEELARAGAKVFIRVGSTGALQPHIGVGDLIVSEGSLRNDGTTAAYVPPGYPAVPDFELTTALIDVGRSIGAERGFSVHSGINATDDAYYAETPDWITKLSSLGITNVDMESSAMFVVARQRGLRAAMVCAVSNNLVTGDIEVGQHNQRLAVGWNQTITVVLETIIRLGI